MKTIKEIARLNTTAINAYLVEIDDYYGNIHMEINVKDGNSSICDQSYRKPTAKECALIDHEFENLR